MKKYLSAALAASIAVSYVGISAVYAKDSEDAQSASVVVLGDSIASGYGLSKNEVTYGEMLADYYGGAVANYAVPGYTSADTLNQVKSFNSAQLDQLSNAEIVVISTGGNDLLQYAASSIIQFAEVNNLLAEGVTAEDIPSNPSFDSIQTYVDMDAVKTFANVMVNAQALSNRLDNIYKHITFTDKNTNGSAYTQVIAKQVIPNIEETVSIIRSANPDARIVVQNIYDPFKFERSYEEAKLAEYSAANKVAYSKVKAIFKNTTEKFAAQISDLSDVEIADVYTNFESLNISEDNYENRYSWYFTNVQAGRDNFDIHPNQAGHVAIASAIINTLSDKECVGGNLLVKTHDTLSNLEKYPQTARESYEKAVSDVKPETPKEPETTTKPATTTESTTTSTTTKATTSTTTSSSETKTTSTTTKATTSTTTSSSESKTTSTTTKAATSTTTSSSESKTTSTTTKAATSTTTTTTEISEPDVTTVIAFGDVNNDGMVNSSDASAILTEYSRIQTGGDPSFSEEEFAAADVNKDGTIDSSDASMVLRFYAYIQTGGTLDSMEEWANSENNTSSEAPSEDAADVSEPTTDQTPEETETAETTEAA